MLKFIKEKLYFLKKWRLLVFLYPKKSIGVLTSGDDYWDERGMNEGLALNDWQLERAQFVIRRVKNEKNVTLTDIGCGDGSVLAYIARSCPSVSQSVGIDASPVALKRAEKRGVHTVQSNFTTQTFSEVLPESEYALLFEVLEHVPVSEVLLRVVYGKAKKGVFFSVPNTGYFLYRLRLLFGKTPMQWRTHPSEHLRFWTLADLKWWLKSQGYNNCELYPYKGVPVLSRLWPSMFAAGLIVYIPK